tara:strand:- start:12067 stop:12597 length:531 start_codon:yes stop_codon:yes gene_type:complete
MEQQVFSATFVKEVSDSLGAEKTATVLGPATRSIGRGVGELAKRFLSSVSGKTTADKALALAKHPAIKAYFPDQTEAQIIKRLRAGKLGEGIRYTAKGTQKVVPVPGAPNKKMLERVNPFEGQGYNPEVVKKLQDLAKARGVQKVTRLATLGGAGYGYSKYKKTRPRLSTYGGYGY